LKTIQTLPSLVAHRLMAALTIDDRQPADARAPPGRRRFSPWPSGRDAPDDVAHAFEPGLSGRSRGIEFDDAGNSAHGG